MNAVAEPQAERLAPGVVKVDGFNGFAPLALEAGREPLVELAREQGIAALAITNTHHFSALWPETEALAERGLVGFAFVAAMAYVAPAGGLEQEGARLPSDRRYAARRRTPTEGITIPQTLHDTIESLRRP